MKATAFFLVSALLLVGSLSSPSHAQVTTNITSSGLGTTVTPAGNVFTITGGTRPGGGPNLFHSFGQFNLGSGDTANFFNNTGLFTTNILSRVTGGNPSNIFGTIQTTGFGGANLWLINPAGVIFGSTASLNVGGSFHVSTADYVRLHDGTSSAYFYANSASDNLANSVLSVTPPVNFGFLAPAAFGFSDPNPASITVDGAFLAVPTGQAISLVGGNRTFTRDDTGDTVPAGVTVTGGAYVSAPGGQINLVSVASPGEVLMPSLQYAPNVNGESFTGFGNVNLSQFAVLDVSGDPAGTVLIRGGQFVMDSAFITAFNGNADAPAAADIDMKGDVTFSNGSFIFSATVDGAGGDISVAGKTFSITDGSIIFSDSSGAGKGGKITIHTSDSLSVTGMDVFGNPSLILNLAESGGDGGAIDISAGSMLLDRGTIQTLTLASGNGGALNIQVAQNLTITNGGAIDSSGSSSVGKITINAGDTITVSGQFDPITPSRITVNGTGDMEITAGKFILADNARIQNLTVVEAGGNVAISASESIMISSGSKVLLSIRDLPGGTLSLSAPSVTIAQAALQTTTAGVGDAGAITINARNLTLSSAGTISAESTSTGNAGNIQINASDSLVMQNHSTISTATILSDGGNITLQVGRLVQLTDSQITTSVQGGTGNGGNIVIDPTFVILRNGQIIANAFGGNGGNITIVAGFFSADPFSVVSASSALGISGTVSIQASVTNLSGTLAPLSEDFLQAAALLRAGCAVRFQGGTLSSFVVTGRDGVPLEPGGMLPSPLLAESGGGARLAGLDVPGLRVGRSFSEQDLALAALSMGCAS